MFFAALAVCWMGLITYSSGMQGSQLKVARTMYVMPHRTAHWAAGTNAPTGFWGAVDRQNYTNILDKPVHMAEFAVLMLLWWRAFSVSHRALFHTRALVIAAAISIPFACLDEYHQSFTPGRQMRAGDLAANCAGVLIAAGLVVAWHAWKKE